jgi:hypothetical protein
MPVMSILNQAKGGLPISTSFSAPLDGPVRIGTHRAVVPSYIPVNLTFGPHKITLLPATADTTSDYNDLFDVILIY